jgi:4-aminobutyrate aminotransferase-like enzyme
VLIVPPLNITREELDEGLAALDSALAVADEYAA